MHNSITTLTISITASDAIVEHETDEKKCRSDQFALWFIGVRTTTIRCDMDLIVYSKTEHYVLVSCHWLMIAMPDLSEIRCNFFFENIEIGCRPMLNAKTKNR